MVTYLPHFISTVVMVGIMLIPSFPQQRNLRKSGPGAWRSESGQHHGRGRRLSARLCVGDVWQHAGWDSIIYIAALAAVDPSLYEAATVDGASKIQRLWHIECLS